MALIAYLMEFKGNYGPHLIIVPNAVLVNWKVVAFRMFVKGCCGDVVGGKTCLTLLVLQSEFLNWLPSVSCIFYVGNKEQRSRLFSQVRKNEFAHSLEYSLHNNC